MDRRELTEKQRAIYDWMVAQVEEHGCVPSIRETMRQFGLASTNAVAVHLTALARKGWVKLRGQGRRLLLLKVKFKAIHDA